MSVHFKVVVSGHCEADRRSLPGTLWRPSRILVPSGADVHCYRVGFSGLHVSTADCRGSDG